MRSFSLVIVQFFANAIALKVADYFLLGITFEGGFLSLAKTAAVITALNVVVKPLAKKLISPLIILSFGLGIILLNAALLWLATFWAPELKIATYWDLLLATLIFTAINAILWLSGRIFK